jgi:hypothetical protein
MRMAHGPANPFDEPFGQAGVRKYLRPLFLTACAIAVCICMLLMVRSYSNYDRFFRIADGNVYTVGSVMDRILFTVQRLPTPEPDSGSWSFSSSPVETMRDGWAPSWRKTLGIDWGEEIVRDGDTQTYWRLRIRWRTLIAIYMLPLLWEVVRRRLHRRRVSTLPLRATS